MKLSWQRKLLIFMTSQTVSMLGSSIVSLSLIWYVTLQTNSGIAITGITITTFLPQALIMLVGGVIADRFPLKKIIMLSDSFTALSTLCLHVETTLFYGYMFLIVCVLLEVVSKCQQQKASYPHLFHKKN